MLILALWDDGNEKNAKMVSFSKAQNQKIEKKRKEQTFNEQSHNLFSCE